jgi:hypothetical protein
LCGWVAAVRSQKFTRVHGCFSYAARVELGGVVEEGPPGGACPVEVPLTELDLGQWGEGHGAGPAFLLVPVAQARGIRPVGASQVAEKRKDLPALEIEGGAVVRAERGGT